MILRPRQTAFVDRAVAALREHGNTLAVAPTGFGKTIAMAAIIGRLLAGGGRDFARLFLFSFLPSGVSDLQTQTDRAL